MNKLIFITSLFQRESYNLENSIEFNVSYPPKLNEEISIVHNNQKIILNFKLSSYSPNDNIYFYRAIE